MFSIVTKIFIGVPDPNERVMFMVRPLHRLITHVYYVLKKVSLGKILISLYAFLLIFTQIAGHGYVADAHRELYIEFKDLYPEHARGFKWSFGSRLSFTSGLALGVVPGLFIAIYTYTIIRRLEKLVEILRKSEHSKDLWEKTYKKATFLSVLIAIIYITTFLIVGLAVNPHFLLSIIDLVYTVVSGALLGVIVLMYFTHLERYWTRLKFYKDREIQLLLFKLEHEEIKTAIHILIAIGLGFITTIIAGVIQYVNLHPNDISSSPSFWRAIYSVGFFYMLLLLGYFVGIIYIHFCMLGELKDAIREYSKMLESIKQEQ